MQNENLVNLLHGLERFDTIVKGDIKNQSVKNLLAYYEQLGILIYRALLGENMFSVEIVYPAQSLQNIIINEIENRLA
jgi:hypothetical protein